MPLLRCASGLNPPSLGLSGTILFLKIRNDRLEARAGKSAAGLQKEPGMARPG